MMKTIYPSLTGLILPLIAITFTRMIDEPGTGLMFFPDNPTLSIILISALLAGLWFLIIPLPKHNRYNFVLFPIGPYYAIKRKEPWIFGVMLVANIIFCSSITTIYIFDLYNLPLYVSGFAVLACIVSLLLGVIASVIQELKFRRSTKK